jgi:hypothetical protein
MLLPPQPKQILTMPFTAVKLLFHSSMTRSGQNVSSKGKIFPTAKWLAMKGM